MTRCADCGRFTKAGETRCLAHVLRRIHEQAPQPILTAEQAQTLASTELKAARLERGYTDRKYAELDHGYATGGLITTPKQNTEASMAYAQTTYADAANDVARGKHRKAKPVRRHWWKPKGRA